MRELKLKYFLELVSNIGTKSRAEAQMLEESQKRMDKAVSQTADKMLTLDRVISKVGTNTSTERQITYMQRLASSIDAAGSRALKLRQNLARAVDKAPEWAAQGAAGYAGAKMVMAPPLRAYSSLEAAETGLKIAMMTKGGKVSGDYEAIKKIAVDQGNKLPGSTKDMTEAATELIALGITPEAVKNGGLVASTNLGVVLGIQQTQAAMTTAKLREAFSLKDNELPQMADKVQRNRYAGGIAPEELLMAAKYEAPIVNALGMGGLQGMSDVLTVQGMANQKGMNGGEFGTNFAEMLTRLASGPLMLEESKKGIKADARERLDALGIKFDFFDDKGQLKKQDGSAVKGIFAELEKFNLIKNKDGSSDDRTRLEVAKALFGSEGGRPALIMAQAGLKGFEAARARVDNQASLDERINERLSTFASKLEALGGTIENVMAQIGTQTGQALKPGMDGLNNILGGPVGDLFKNHPGVGTAGLLGAGAAGMYLSGRVGGALWKSLILRGAPAATEAAQAGGAAAVGAAPGGAVAAKILRGAPAATEAVQAGGAAAVGAAPGGAVAAKILRGAPAAAETAQAAQAGGTAAVGAAPGGAVAAKILRGAPAATEAAQAGGAAAVGAAPGGAVAAQAGMGGMGMSAAGPVAAPSLAANALKAAKSAAKWGGISTAIFGGLEAIGVLADDKADKPRDLARIGVTSGGAVAGMAAGAALGSIVPVIGTAIGGLIGGILGSLGGSYGAGAAFDSMWAKKSPQDRQAERQQLLPPDVAMRTAGLNPAFGNVPGLDLLTLTAPGAMPTQLAAGRMTEVKVGEGTLAIDVRVTDERVSATPTVVRPLSLVRINAGNTNPGGFAR